MKDIRIPDSYEVIDRHTITDLNSEGLLLRHKKTHARVALLLNDDDNKVFYIGFRTPPKDSKGVAHIIEHTVLCGSDAFPIKDPFMELVKGSLNTFLNAMTYPDKTVYPLASCNDKDFKNLMHVYMDAVFRPNIYKDERIFKQEGWHYELEDEDAELTINGVVYNEMKGSMSAPESVLSYEMRASLFPDTTYGILSGGDPDVIPDLTYEEYLDFHRTHYHPTNSYIYLYGDIDAEERLTWLDEAYLSHFERLEADTMPGMQEPFSAPKEDLTKPYSVLPEQSTEKSTYLSYNVCAGDNLDKERYIAFDVLDYVLCDAPGAILKQALIKAGIGTDVYSAGSAGIRQVPFSVVAKGAELSQRGAFIDCIRTTLEKAVAEGLDHRALYAGINQNEFQYREADFGRYPKGLMYGLQVLDSWVYDDMQPFLHVDAGATYASLKKKVKEGYFEALIREVFLDNPHRTVLALVPERGLNAKKDAALKDKLSAMKAGMSKEEIRGVIDATKDLRDWQEAPEDEEDVKKIPTLALSDIRKEADPFFNEAREEDGVRVLFHDVATNGVLYVNLVFDMEHVPEDLFPYVGILKTMLGMVDTAEHGYADLANEVNIHTGGFSETISSHTLAEDPSRYIRTFEIGFKVLKDELATGFALAKEIITTSDFSDAERIKELMDELKSRMKEDLTYSGHQTAVLRALSHLSERACLAELINGISAFRMVEELDADDIVGMRKRGKMSKMLARLARIIFRRENLLVDFTAPAEDYAAFVPYAKEFAEALFTEPVAEGYFTARPEKANEAFQTAGQVQYVCRAGNFIQRGLPFSGRLRLLTSILATEYLWQNIRVKGGAYGAMCRFARNGDCYFVTYRDPHLKRSVDVFADATEFVRTFTATDREMTRYIIGVVSELDQPKTPFGKGAYSMSAYLTRLSYEQIQKDRDDLLSATDADVRALVPYVEALLEDDVLCVVGTQEKIEAHREIFDTVDTLFHDDADGGTDG